jgi:hypothetical protein
VGRGRGRGRGKPPGQQHKYMTGCLQWSRTRSRGWTKCQAASA